MEKWNSEVKKTIVSLYKSGRSVQALSEEHGIPRATIYTWINKNRPMHNIEDSKTTVLSLEMQRNIQMLKEENDVLRQCISIILNK